MMMQWRTRQLPRIDVFGRHHQNLAVLLLEDPMPVMDGSVMSRAHEHQIVHIRRPAGGPGSYVVGIAPPRMSPADDTPAVTRSQRAALGEGHESFSPAHVQRPGRPVVDGQPLQDGVACHMT
jgi:hypothetical protein